MNFRKSALAILSGLLLAASFPTINLHVLAWFALVPLFYVLKGQTPRNGFLLGGLAGIVYFSGTVHWVTNSVHYYGNVPIIPASLITLLLAAYLSLYTATFGAVVAKIYHRRPSVLFFAAPAIWTALELARTYVFSGFPWALLGYSQYEFLPVIQVADITGVYGISFLVVLVNAAAMQIATGEKRTAALLTVTLVAVTVLGYGLFSLSQAEGSGSFRISVVQGNIEQDKKWDPAYQNQTIATYKKLTLEALKQNPDLVIWPETSTPFYFTGSDAAERKMADDLKDFVQQNNVPLLFGSPTYEITKQRKVVLRNSAFLLSGKGDISARYDKFHLVPFGEYVPLKNVLFFVEKMVEAVGDFASGKEYTIMSVQRTTGANKMKVSTVICYEIIFPDLVRKFVKRGAGIVTTITNDAWFGRTAAPYQHFSMAVFRAVENRVPIARAANTGISGFIDAKGRILASTKIFTETYATRDVTPGTAKTFYTQYGDIFAYLCGLFALLLVLPLFISPDKSRSL